MTEDITGFLLDQFEILADAPGGVQRLRELILQLAVTGRLDNEHLIRLETNNGNDEFQIPQNWNLEKLLDISDGIQYGFTASADSTNTGIHLLRISDIQNNKVNWETVPFCSVDEKLIGQYLLSNGDLLIARTGGTIGKSFLVENIFVKSIFASYLIRVKPGKLLNPKYLKVFANAPLYWSQITAKSMGTGQPNVSGTSLKSLQIPLPPYDTQISIVEKVDSLMALCDDLEAKKTQKHSHLVKLGTGSLNALQQSTTEEELIRWWGHLQTNFGLIFDCPENVEALRQTILQLAVTGRLGTNKIAENVVKSISSLEISSQSLNDYQVTLSNVPQNWIWCKLSDLADVKSGVTKNSSQKIDDPIEVPYLRVANVQRGFLDLTHMKTIIVSKLRLPELTLKKGDILFTEGGDFDKLGRGWIWNEEIQCCTHQNHIFRARLYTDHILGEYISYYANYEGVNYFQQCSKQTTNLASINSKQLKNFPIPIPPLAEQHRIIEKVECLMNFCDDLERGIEKRDNKEAVLSNAILQKIVIMT